MYAVIGYLRSYILIRKLTQSQSLLLIMTKFGIHLVLMTALLSATDSVRSPANFSDGYLKSCGPDQTILLRKRRFLTFPPRSELLFRISLLKSTPWKTNVFTIHEIDVQHPLPENLHAILFEKDSTQHESRTRANGAFLDYFTEVLELIGLNGWVCANKLQCEVMRLKSNFLDKSFLLQVLHRLMRPHSNMNTKLRRNGSCSKFFECPVTFIPDFMMEDFG
uniref:Coiled-coil domain-containing protein 47 n=1 Tax=Lygus hesperus TaxID=30085 RepID=A0A0A9VXN9_LYGHE